MGHLLSFFAVIAFRPDHTGCQMSSAAVHFGGTTTGRRKAIYRGCAAARLAILMMSASPWCPAFQVPTVSAQPATGEESSIRSCPAGSDQLAKARPSSSRKKHGQRFAPALTDACLEVHSSALVVQERLQKFVRDQSWSVDDERIDENLWTFHRELSPQELLAFAKPEPAAAKVEWRKGRATLLVRTVELDNGFSRTTISAKFDGYGDVDDALATQRSSWSLFSNGQLEANLAAGLRSTYQSAK
jgi:hypothetical protein